MEDIEKSDEKGEEPPVTNQQPMERKIGEDQNMTTTDMIEDDPLDRCPPDFDWAKKHREANMVKNLDAKNLVNKDLEDEELYCQ